MATPAPEQPSTSLSSQSAPQQTSPGSTSSHDASPLSPVEMKTLPTAANSSTSDAVARPAAAPAQSQESRSTQASQPALEPAAPAAPSKLAPPTAMTRSETEAIGPSTDTPAANPDNSNGPVVAMMLLLITGARHPYNIDGRYLKKRNVSVEDMNPYNISVYTLKELIWRDWRDEWETRPTTPSSIRLIHFGRMLDDKSPLTECRFNNEAANVVHMTIKPQEVVDEEDAKTGKTGNRREGDEESHAGCRCVIL